MAWPICKWEHINPLLGKDVKIETAALSIIQQKPTTEIQRKNWRTEKKKKSISLTFKEATVWVACKVYVHMQKAAEPGTNAHCSIL